MTSSETPSRDSPRKLIDDCFSHGSGSLTHDEAIALLTGRLAPIVGTERVPLFEATGRVLAKTVTAPRDIPAHDNAAVDGYAFAHAHYDEARGTRFPVAGRAAPGHPLGAALKAGEAARILTGAVMPDGANTVAMQEDVSVEGDGVVIPGGLKHGANRRRAGEDVAAGEAIAAAGMRLRPQDIAAMAATGLGEAPCHRRLRVALFSTGDELLPPGSPFSPGRVYDANAPMLAALTAIAGHPARFLGILPDDAASVRARLAEAAGAFDVVITSGGASQGDGDHIAATLQALGSLTLWRLAIKPGRPMSLGQVGDCVFLGLPGNPVAVFVCFLLYAMPALALLGGETWRPPARRLLPAAFSLARRRTGRREFLRGITADHDGKLCVKPYPRDGSALISSLRESSGLIELPEGLEALHEHEPVNFIPYSEFGIRDWP